MSETNKCCSFCYLSNVAGRDECADKLCACHVASGITESSLGIQPPTTGDNDWEKRFEEESPLAFGGREWAKSFISSALLARDKHWIEVGNMMLQSSPNPLKQELVHNKGEADRMKYNAGYNRGIKDFIKRLEEGRI